jgi:hypothetical protein
MSRSMGEIGGQAKGLLRVFGLLDEFANSIGIRAENRSDGANIGLSFFFVNLRIFFFTNVLESFSYDLGRWGV